MGESRQKISKSEQSIRLVNKLKTPDLTPKTSNDYALIKSEFA